MSTTFHHEATVTFDSCDACGATVPADPFTIFPFGIRFMATLCPGCQETVKIQNENVSHIMSSGLSISELLDLGADPERVETFDHTLELEHKVVVPRASIRVVAGERCTHCGEPLDVPQDLAEDQTTAIHCTSCEKDTHLVPPPRWLKQAFPVMSHVMTPEAPSKIPCPRCEAPIRVGARAPREVKCEHCEDRVSIDAPTSKDLEPAPWFARLRLTPETVRLSKGTVGLWIGASFLAVTTALIVLAVLGILEGGDSAKGGALLGVCALIPAAIGSIALALSIRGRQKLELMARRLEEGPPDYVHVRSR